MIASLRGQVTEKSLNSAIIDVNGVGYRVHFSLLTLTKLPDEGQTAAVRIQTIVREDALELFGFLAQAEEEMFLLLTSVSHVGPKLAITILSGLEVVDLAAALARGDVGRLTKLHGVGKKTAERLVLELREKVKKISIQPKPMADAVGLVDSETQSDLVSALVNLGYKPAQAEKAAGFATDRIGANATFEVLFREALRGLRAGA